MKVWLIRHAPAVERAAFAGDDLERPLTEAGRREAQRVFARLALLRRGPEVVVSSEAVRAWETARLLCLAYGLRDFQRTAALNPGARFKDLRKVVAGLPKQVGFVALVGHEPDFSEAVARWTSDGALRLDVRKTGLVELEWTPGQPARLVMAVPPDLLAGG
jgi:phosphohistidine phosphatase